MRSALYLAIPTLFILLSCTAEQEPDAALAAAVESIQEHNRAVETALSNRDLDALMAEIVEDAVWMPPNEEILVGKERIRAFYEELFSQSDFEGALDPNNQELQVFGDWAVFRSVLVGTATPPGGGEETPIANKLVNLLHREPDGTWKHVWDIWNSSPTDASYR
jgi:uncharacterized protein (TIGR02246 family)